MGPAASPPSSPGEEGDQPGRHARLGECQVFGVDLQNSFSLTPKTLTLSTESPSLRIPDHFTKLLPNIGASIASQFFLRGFNRCCSRTSSSVETLVRFYAAILKNSDAVPCGLEVDDDGDDGDNGKVGRRFTPSDLLMLLWVCWITAQCSRISKLSKRGEDDEMVVLPDLSHLVLSAFVWCGDVQDDEGVWHCDVFNDGDRSVSAQKVKMWILAVIPGLAQCLPLYVREARWAEMKRRRGEEDMAGDCERSANIEKGRTRRVVMDVWWW